MQFYKKIFVGLFLLLTYANTNGQTTDIEKKAATKIIKEIELFDNKYHPTRLAEHMASKTNNERDAVVQRAEEIWNNEMKDLSDWIGHHPEYGFQEFKAVDTLTKVIKKNGFEVDVGIAGFETAFMARFDSPAGINGPKLGFLLEYDALRDGNGAYHGDQHNAQSPTAIAAAVALKEFMIQESIPGQLFLYGTPSEEMGPPVKAIMTKKGIFDKADILIRSHSGQKMSRNEAGFGSCCFNINDRRFTFKGKITHQRSSWTGRNALEAGVMFYTGVDRMRSSWRNETSIGGIIVEGGKAENNVPDSVVLDYSIRYPDEIYLRHVTDMVENIAEGAALATGTKVEIERNEPFLDGISLGTLEELAFAYEQKYAEDKENLDFTKGRPAGYEETGMPAREIPGVGIHLASSIGPNHSKQMLDDAFNEFGHRGFKIGSKVMAALMYDFLMDKKYRELVIKEHQMLKTGFDDYLENLKKLYYDEIHIQID